MKPIDFVIIAVIALLVVLAIVSIRRQKKRGGCCGCSGCSGCCSQCEKVKINNTQSRHRNDTGSVFFLLSPCEYSRQNTFGGERDCYQAARDGEIIYII